MLVKFLNPEKKDWVQKGIVLFITKNHTVHRFNVCTRNIIQIGNHEYIYQIIAGRKVKIMIFSLLN